MVQELPYKAASSYMCTRTFRPCSSPALWMSKHTPRLNPEVRIEPLSVGTFFDNDRPDKKKKKKSRNGSFIVRTDNEVELLLKITPELQLIIYKKMPSNASRGQCGSTFICKKSC